MSSSFFKKRLSPIKPVIPSITRMWIFSKIHHRTRQDPSPSPHRPHRKQQRDLTNAVKRARIVALLPFVNPEG